MPVSPVFWWDEFETTNVSPFGWTSTSVAAGCALAVVSVIKHHSGYSLQCDTNGLAAGTQNARVNETITEANLLYVRGYFRLAAHGIVDDLDQITLIRFRAGTNVLLAVGWRQSSADSLIHWVMIGRNGTGWTTTYSTSIPSLHTWYCVEAYWKLHATAGEYKLYIDGIELITRTSVDTDNYGGVDEVSVGIVEAINCQNPSQVFADCVAFSTMRIKCEEALRTCMGRGGDFRGKTNLFSVKRSGTRMHLH